MAVTRQAFANAAPMALRGLLLCLCLAVACSRFGDTGKSCQKASECGSGHCLTVREECIGDVCGLEQRVCTGACERDDDCIPGWTCAFAPLQKVGICSCVNRQQSEFELCDGRDNDCNGIIDDNPRPCDENGTTCAEGACQCPAGETSCDGRCTTLIADVRNCGACGHFCGQHAFCQQSQCVCSGATSCDGQCVLLNDDPRHCGSCDHVCPGNQPCSQGMCGCPPGQTLCGGSCADLSSDVTHCGACEKQCPVFPGAEARCVDGACG